MRLRVETKVVVSGDEITIDLTGSNPEVPTGFNVPFEGSLLVGAYYAVRTILLDEVVPRPRSAERRRLPTREGGRTQGDDLQPHLPARVLLGSPRCSASSTARSSPWPTPCRTRSRPAIPAASHTAYSGFDESAGEYWLYLEVNEGSYGGRHGRTRWTPSTT